jgi:restriction system protein
MAKARKTSSAIPTNREIRKPLLALLQRKREVSLDEAIAYVAQHFRISESLQKRKQGCGKESVLQNRLRWARWELMREGRVETTRRGYFRLTKKGKDKLD